MDEIVIGYDERERKAKVMPARFLLKEVEFLRSADRYVWPSLRPEISFSAIKASPEGVAIGLTLLIHDDLSRADRSYFSSLNEACSPPTLPDSAVCLGYDVCDKTLVSGLLDCAYSAEEQAIYAERWAPQLNDVHLFASTQHALAFCTQTSARVPEHAPFFVVGVYKCG
jgi:hypothetical protein